MSFHLYSSLLPELKGEVRSHLDVWERTALSRTCLEEHALFESPYGRWPNIVKWKYFFLTGMAKRAVREARADRASFLYDYRDGLLIVGAKISPWLMLRAPDKIDAKSFHWHRNYSSPPRNVWEHDNVDIWFTGNGSGDGNLCAKVTLRSRTVFAGRIKPDDALVTKTLQSMCNPSTN